MNDAQARSAVRSGRGVAQLSDRFTFLVEHLDLEAATGTAGAIFEPYQLQLFNDSAGFTSDEKSRQIGWSWTIAAEAVADAILNPKSNNVFVSINQQEAVEKLRYARMVIEALDADVRPKLKVDNALEIELPNGSRLTSRPCKPVRGKAKARIRLDEFAHYVKDRDIYVSALPATTRGGTIRVGSTPLGASGVFYEIATNFGGTYKNFLRRKIPWWHVSSLRDPSVTFDAELARQALVWTMEERVLRLGSDRIKDIFSAMVAEDAAQEYECVVQDERSAWITWEELKACQEVALDSHIRCEQAIGVEQSLIAIDRLAAKIAEGRLEPRMYVGMDIGRKKDLTEIMLLGKTTTGQMPLRAMLTLPTTTFEDQTTVVSALIEKCAVLKAYVDQTGMGLQLAETLMGRHGSKVEGKSFTAEAKEVWAVGLRVAMQKSLVPIPIDRNLGYQLHSIRRVVSTVTKFAKFDIATSERHHADLFWSLALAVSAATHGGGVFFG